MLRNEDGRIPYPAGTYHTLLPFPQCISSRST